jgi:transmembrane sensor
MNSSSAPEGHASSPTQLEDTAIAWLTERQDGFSLPREREFAQWLRADPRHVATVARLEQTLNLLGELPAFRTEINEAFDRAAPVVTFAPFVPPARRWPRALAWMGLAAALVVGAVLSWHTFQTPAIAHYTTTVAGYERARLADGSTLELNAASSARVQFTSVERRVELKTGEAHFAVAHDTARPFIVSAGKVAVRAVGTAFNVRYAANGDVEVIVTEGKVRIGLAGPSSASTESAPLVSAGQRLVLPNQTPAPVVEKIDPTTLRAALAWQSRLADFAEAPLSDVIARFNARSRIQLILADEQLATRLIGGTFALDEVEAFVRLLERDGEIVGERRGETLIYLRSAR